MFCLQPAAVIVALAIGRAIVPVRSQGYGCPSDLSVYVSTEMCSTTTTTTTVTTTTTTTTTVTTQTTSSTSVTSTLTTTTSSTTLTSTTSTSTSMTTTTSSTTSSTQTSTTSTTSSVTSSTTTTTTTGHVCYLCSNLPITNSEQSLTTDNAQLALTKQTSDCLEATTGDLQVKCENNLQIFPTIKSGGYPKIKCMVCSVTYSADEQQWSDYSGTVSWGPNVKSNSVDETSIKEYRLYLASQGLKVRHLATVTKSSTSSSCCETTKYSTYVQNVELSGCITGGDCSYNFMVVPVDNSVSNVELKFGRMSIDIVNDITLVSGTASGAQRRSISFTMVGPFAGALLATAFAVIALF